jgi:beta-glucosidase
MQAVGVQATIKHYILNEQELNRVTMSSNVDDKTMVRGIERKALRA